MHKLDRPMSLEFREYCCGSLEYTAAVDLRNRVLRLPLGLDIQQDDLSDEPNQRHFGAWRGQQLVASLSAKRLSPEVIKLRQMCVDPSLQGQGVGRQLIEFVEQRLAADGINHLELAARAVVQDFYQRLGYQPVGPQFTEVTIPHQKMVKSLVQ